MLEGLSDEPPTRRGSTSRLACLPLLGAAPAPAATAVKITLKKVGSTYQPYAAKPFSVNRTLAPGASVTFLTGRRASGPNKLYGNYIYNDNGRDGVKVVTTVGTITKHC
jgi:hypothetical protein